MGRGAKSKKNRNRRSTGVRSERNDQIDNQTPEWVIDMNDCLREGLDYETREPWTIYRVPSNMCNVHRKAYIPKLISIGPFHYGGRCFQVMEEHKKRYLMRLLKNISQEKEDLLEVLPPQVHDNECLKSLVEAMKELEGKTRKCYSETFDDIDNDDFVRMMVIDGCFVIELLRLSHKKEKVDPIFTTRWMLRTLQRDFLMLENQLPYFVLEELFKLTSSREETSLKELTLEFFDPLMPRKEKMQKENHEIKYHHLLDLFRDSFLSSVKSKKAIQRSKELLPQRTTSLTLVQEQLIHCATELQEARVEFKMREERDLLDIEFDKDGVLLEIPQLYIDDNTVPLLLNFVAYEQCHSTKSYFSSYFMFLDSLINSAKDVEILHSKGIINHVLGSDEDVANLFNNLCREIVCVADDCQLAKQMEKVNEYYKKYYATKWHDWWTKLIRGYFSSPWTFLSLVAAIVLLLLTFLQTFFACFTYFHPPQPLPMSS